jgi:hypothetical protein
MTDDDWAEIWEMFDLETDLLIDEAFQNEMISKHGDGHYYMDEDERWDKQKKLIQKLINAKLKERNHG